MSAPEAAGASGMKTCSKCATAKPCSEFHKHTKNKDGLQWHCKECRAEHARLTHDPEKARVRRLLNLDRERARGRATRNANKDRENERAKRWHATHPDRVREHKRKHAAAHPGRDMERLNQFIAKNPDRKNMGRKELRDSYVAYVITRRTATLAPNDIPQSLINLKREYLRIARQLKENCQS